MIKVIVQSYLGNGTLQPNRNTMKTPLEIVSIEQAVGIVKSGDRVFFQGAAMTPITL